MDQQTKKILLIEDELFIRELYERVLKQAGFEFFSAVDGIEGWDLIQREAQSPHKPDLVLLDIMMPRLNGIDLLKKLKSDSRTSSIPVILLTNLGQESVIKESFRVGAQGYLMKIRSTPHEVVKLVKDFLENPSARIDPDSLGT